jgi:hypothetical protein
MVRSSASEHNPFDLSACVLLPVEDDWVVAEVALMRVVHHVAIQTLENVLH